MWTVWYLSRGDWKYYAGASDAHTALQYLSELLVDGYKVKFKRIALEDEE